MAVPFARVAETMRCGGNNAGDFLAQTCVTANIEGRTFYAVRRRRHHIHDIDDLALHIKRADQDAPRLIGQALAAQTANLIEQPLISTDSPAADPLLNYRRKRY